MSATPPPIHELVLAALDAVPPPNDWCTETAARIRQAPDPDHEAALVFASMTAAGSARLSAINAWLEGMAHGR